MRRIVAAWAFYVALAAAALGAAQAMARRGVAPSRTRKLVHVAAGLSPLLVAPLAWRKGAILLPYAVTVGANGALLARGGMAGLDTGRRDGGIVFLPLAQLALLAWGWPRRWPAVRAALVALALGDSAAALVGERWGRRRFTVAGQGRTLEGSATLATITALGAWASTGRGGAALGAGLAAAGAEALAPRGSDNLAIPLAVALTLARCARAESGEDRGKNRTR